MKNLPASEDYCSDPSPLGPGDGQLLYGEDTLKPFYSNYGPELLGNNPYSTALTDSSFKEGKFLSRHVTVVAPCGIQLTQTAAMRNGWLI
jgi:hypothetical protein